MGKRAAEAGRVAIVVDTNVLISSLEWKGLPRQVIELVLNGRVLAVTSFPLMEELTRVLQYPRLRHAAFEKKVRLYKQIVQAAVFVEPQERIKAVDEDPSDNRVLECGVESEVDFIVSSDEHLLKLRRFRGILIVSPRRFLDIYPKRR